MHVEMVDVEGTLEHECASGETRDSVALTYAFGLRQHRQDAPVDFGRMNRAILARWSRAGLEYVKTRAWKIVRGEIQP